VGVKMARTIGEVVALKKPKQIQAILDVHKSGVPCEVMMFSRYVQQLASDFNASDNLKRFMRAFDEGGFSACHAFWVCNNSQTGNSTAAYCVAVENVYEIHKHKELNAFLGKIYINLNWFSFGMIVSQLRAFDPARVKKRHITMLLGMYTLHIQRGFDFGNLVLAVMRQKPEELDSMLEDYHRFAYSRSYGNEFMLHCAALYVAPHAAGGVGSGGSVSGIGGAGRGSAGRGGVSGMGGRDSAGRGGVSQQGAAGPSLPSDGTRGRSPEYDSDAFKDFSPDPNVLEVFDFGEPLEAIVAQEQSRGEQERSRESSVSSFSGNAGNGGAYELLSGAEGRSGRRGRSVLSHVDEIENALLRSPSHDFVDDDALEGAFSSPGPSHDRGGPSSAVDQVMGGTPQRKLAASDTGVRLCSLVCRVKKS
jgi:hypothetical protein